MLFGLGFMFPSSTTLAMEKGRKYAGIASSVVGGLGYLAGGLAAPLVGIGDIKLASFSWSFVFLLAGLLIIFFCDHRKTRL
jgi:DHA1 family bicyclomycin/chloramphenicol resistance-like MFS transporter